MTGVCRYSVILNYGIGIKQNYDPNPGVSRILFDNVMLYLGVGAIGAVYPAAIYNIIIA